MFCLFNFTEIYIKVRYIFSPHSIYSTIRVQAQYVAWKKLHISESVINSKEEDLRNCPKNTSISQQLKILEEELSRLTIRKMDIKLNYAKQRNFKFANKPGKCQTYEL